VSSDTHRFIKEREKKKKKKKNKATKGGVQNYYMGQTRNEEKKESGPS
jgi:hypothetical protein